MKLFTRLFRRPAQLTFDGRTVAARVAPGKVWCSVYGCDWSLEGWSAKELSERFYEHLENHP